MLHALIAVTIDTYVDNEPGRARYAAGERYTVREDVAAKMVADGAAAPLEVPEQRIDAGFDGAGTVATPDQRAATMTKLLALVPKTPAAAPEPAPAAAATPEPPEPGQHPDDLAALAQAAKAAPPAKE